METKMFKRLFRSIGLVLSITVAGQTAAADSVMLVTPYGAGSGPDVLARAFAEQLGVELETKVVVMNKTGGNGLIGIEAFRSGQPGTVTLVITDSSMLTINPYLYRRLPYSPKSDFAPLTMLADTPFNLLVSAKLKLNTLAELLDYARKNPGKLSYGAPTGTGHPGHLGMEDLKLRTGMDVIFVPYTSSPPMLSDLATGRLQLAWATYASSKAIIENGGAKMLATGAPKRLTDQPDLPTVAEAGGPKNFTVNSWLAVYASPSLPASTMKKMQEASLLAAKSESVQARIRALGYENASGGHNEVTTRLDADSENYHRIIDALKLKLD